MADESLQQLRDEVRVRLGIDESVSGEQALIAAVSRCMAAQGLVDRDVYCARVLQQKELFDALIEELVVPESWFFRDLKPFAWLAEWATQRRQRAPGVPLRILSAPCAAGQEPYSVVITLLEAGFQSAEFVVEAGDVSARNLQQARAAVYKGYAFRGQREDLRQRYFTSNGEGIYTLADALRPMVAFKRMNLVQPEWDADRPRYDAVFCRNLLIYLTADARQRVVRWLTSSLAADGLLFVGHADDLNGLTKEFAMTGPPGSFCFQKREASPAEKPPTIPANRPAPVRRQSERKRRSTPAAPPVAAAIDAVPRDSSSWSSARRLADSGQLAKAASLCETAIASGLADSEGYVLYATILSALGRDSEAERALRNALYLNPTCSDALLQLALFVERRGDLPEASRLRRRLQRGK